MKYIRNIPILFEIGISKHIYSVFSRRFIREIGIDARNKSNRYRRVIV